MNAFAKLAVSTSLAFAAFGAGAQTIETDYPVVRGTGSQPSTMQVLAAPSQAPSRADPFLIQSNNEGVRVSPSQQRSSALTRAEVQHEASIVLPYGASNNA